jgi:hypothetical protein
LPSYVFREGPVAIHRASDADPQRLGEATEGPSRIIEAKIAAGEKLDRSDALPRLILADVKRQGRRHAFHRHLLWDDVEAAERYRLGQVAAIVRLICVADDEGEPERPAFVNITSPPEGRAYRSTGVVIGSLDLQIATLRRAEADLAAFQKRYRTLTDICQQAAELESLVRERREQLTAAARSAAA